MTTIIKRSKIILFRSIDKFQKNNYSCFKNLANYSKFNKKPNFLSPNLSSQQVCNKKTKANLNSYLYQYNKQFNKMIRIRFERNADRVAISIKCKITEDSEREFNLSRTIDEPIGQTFQKLYGNFMKQYNSKINKANKKIKKDSNSQEQTQGALNTANVTLEDIPISLYDLDNNLISLDTKNVDAWKENYTLKLNDQMFKVTVDLPAIKKVSLSKLLVAGLPAIVKIESEYEELSETLNKFSKFNWYCSKEKFENGNKDILNNINQKLKIASHDLEKIEWNLISQNDSRKIIILEEECEDKLIKVEVTPSDGNRNGIAVDTVSTNIVVKKLNLDEFPMSDRHKMTTNCVDSNTLRVMSYNILANCYSETTVAQEQLYPYCPSEYLDFKYRRTLIIHEILNYNSDIIFLQECEVDFFEEDLKSALPNYTHKFKAKGQTREGESISFRSDRFKFVNSFDICITEELKSNPIFENFWKKICKNEEIRDYILPRTTILQIVQVESLDNPGVHYLLANTHLFFHPNADFIRLIQAVVCTKYIEKLKYHLLNEKNSSGENLVKDVKVIFGGDFNSDPPSYAFTYIFTQTLPVESLKPEEKELINECDDELIHSLNLSAYTDFPFTNCIASFEAILDYVFYETDAFELTKVIPLPSVERVKENVALPSKYIPSDHLPIIFELAIKNNSNKK